MSAALVAACAASGTTTHQSDAAVFDRVMLTNDGADLYTFTTGDGAVTVNAPTTNQGLNLRMLFWPDAGSVTSDSESCADWTTGTGTTQQGALMRIAPLPNRALRAILVTKNIWYGGIYFFNVYVVDTRQVPLLRRVGFVSLHGELNVVNGVPTPLPWSMCARASGDQVSILVWRSGEPVPRWGDRSHGGSVALPAGWTYPGKAGWYIGHIPSGSSAGFTNLSTSTAPGLASAMTTWANRDMVMQPLQITRSETTLADVATSAGPR